MTGYTGPGVTRSGGGGRVFSQELREEFRHYAGLHGVEATVQVYTVQWPAPVLREAHHSAEVQVPVWEARGEFLTAPILSISLHFLTQIPRRENRAKHIQKWTKEYVDEVSDKDAF